MVRVNVLSVIAVREEEKVQNHCSRLCSKGAHGIKLSVPCLMCKSREPENVGTYGMYQNFLPNSREFYWFFGIQNILGTVITLKFMFLFVSCLTVLLMKGRGSDRMRDSAVRQSCLHFGRCAVCVWCEYIRQRKVFNFVVKTHSFGPAVESLPPSIIGFTMRAVQIIHRPVCKFYSGCPCWNRKCKYCIIYCVEENRILTRTCDCEKSITWVLKTD